MADTDTKRSKEDWISHVDQTSDDWEPEGKMGNDPDFMERHPSSVKTEIPIYVKSDTISTLDCNYSLRSRGRWLLNAAYFRSDAIQRLKDLSPQIAIHLVKLSSVPSGQDVNGWQRELEAWRGSLSLVNHGKKGRENLSIDGVFEEVYERHMEGEEDLQNILQLVKRAGIDISGFSLELARILCLTFAEAVIHERPFKVPNLSK